MEWLTSVLTLAADSEARLCRFAPAAGPLQLRHTHAAAAMSESPQADSRPAVRRGS